MALQLTVIKSPPGMTLKEDRRVFSGAGVIGRSAKCDWVLQDPERFLSSRHCEIKYTGNAYFLIDQSTNGTFVNGAQEPLGRGTKVQLNDGDSFDVGDYRFKVSFDESPASSSDSPFDDDLSPFDQPLVEPEPEYGDRSPAPESMYMGSEYSGAASDIVPDDMKVVDPLVALNISPKDSSRNKEEQVKASGGYGGSQEDSANFMSSAADWPDVKGEDSVIPEDWDDDISLLGARKPAKQDAAGPGPAYKLPDDDSLIVNKNDESIAPRPQPRPPQKPKAPSSPRPEPEARPTQQPSSKSSTPSLGRGGSVDRSLVDAMGFEGIELSDEQIREIHRTVGAMTRETIEGLMAILRSRTSIKNEFRINITTIQPIENNPLKFSANVDEVLENMFLKNSRAYKKPLDAVQESFNTIVDHQMAVIAGIRSAFKSVLTQFDPITLEEAFKEGGKSGVLGGVMKGKLWTAYQAHYQSMVNNMERSFQELFGDEFVQAYEDQLRKLSKARNHER